MEWARTALPENAQFVGGSVVSPNLPSGTGEPSAELIKGATLYLVTTQHVSRETINLVTTFCTAVGASARFIDAVEHDGLMAATSGLPMVAAMALFQAISEPAGWEDRVRGVGGEVSSLGQLLPESPEDGAQRLTSNADHIAVWLDALIRELEDLRDVLSANDREALEEKAAAAYKTYRDCLARGKTAATSAMPDGGSALRDMFLGRLGRR
jgi:prephenate dehydrogenase